MGSRSSKSGKPESSMGKSVKKPPGRKPIDASKEGSSKSDRAYKNRGGLLGQAKRSVAGRAQRLKEAEKKLGL